jgi:hypothetical protein
VNEATSDAMLQRLIQLEQEARRRKVVGRVLMLLLGLVVSLGATRSQERTTLDEIRAQRFVLTDAHGKTVGLLTGAQKDIGLSLLDAAGRSRLTLAIGANGEPFITLFSARGQSGVSIGSSEVYLSDLEGRTRLSLGTAGNEPMVMLWDSTKRVRMALGLSDRGEPGIILSDKAEKTIWRAP